MEFRILSMGFYFEWLLLAKVRMTISIESLMLKLENSCTRMLVELWDEEIWLKVWDKLCLDDRIQGVGLYLKQFIMEWETRDTNWPLFDYCAD